MYGPPRRLYLIQAPPVPDPDRFEIMRAVADLPVVETVVPDGFASTDPSAPSRPATIVRTVPLPLALRDTLLETLRRTSAELVVARAQADDAKAIALRAVHNARMIGPSPIGVLHGVGWNAAITHAEEEISRVFDPRHDPHAVRCNFRGCTVETDLIVDAYGSRWCSFHRAP